MNGFNFLTRAIGRSAHLPSHGSHKSGPVEKVIAAGMMVITGIVGGAAFWSGHKAEQENAARQPHTFYQPEQTAAYFHTLNAIEGKGCRINFQDGNKNSRPQNHTAVTKLGDCMQIAFNSNQKRDPSDRGLSITFNAAKKYGAVSGDCDFREKTDTPYCIARTKSDKFFLEQR